jgi:hypothetical protein
VHTGEPQKTGMRGQKEREREAGTHRGQGRLVLQVLAPDHSCFVLLLLLRHSLFRAVATIQKRALQPSHVVNVCASSTDAYMYTYMCSMYVRAVQVSTCMQDRSFCINLEKIKALRGEGEGAGLLLYRHFCAVARQEPTCRRS